MKTPREDEDKESQSQESESIWGILSRTKDSVAKLSEKNGEKQEYKELLGDILELERKYIEQQNAKIKKYKLVFDHVNTGIGFSDTKTKKIIELNPKICEIFEIESEDYIGKEYPSFFSEFILDKEVFEKGKEVYRRGGEVSGLELSVLTKKGNYKHILVYSVRITDIDNEFFTVVDITESKELSKSKQQMKDILVHDLKNCSLGISGLAGRLIAKGGFDEATTTKLERILKTADRSTEIIDSHLDLIKMERGEFEPKSTSIDLIDLIGDIKSGFEAGKISEKSRIILRDFDDEIHKRESFDILGDEKWIYNLLSNLLKNALEHSSGGENVDVFLEKKDNSVIIKIHNNGAIPVEIRDKLFVDKYITYGKVGGTGLGIYSAKLITESHEGKISFETSEDTGTTFIIILKAGDVL